MRYFLGTRAQRTSSAGTGRSGITPLLSARRRACALPTRPVLEPLPASLAFLGSVAICASNISGCPVHRCSSRIPASNFRSQQFTPVETRMESLWTPARVPGLFVLCRKRAEVQANNFYKHSRVSFIQGPTRYDRPFLWRRIGQSLRSACASTPLRSRFCARTLPFGTVRESRRVARRLAVGMPRHRGGVRAEPCPARRPHPVPRRLLGLLPPVVSDYGNRGGCDLARGERAAGSRAPEATRTSRALRRGPAQPGCPRRRAGSLGSTTATGRATPVPGAGRWRLYNLRAPSADLP